jgi:hypothetical protein
MAAFPGTSYLATFVQSLRDKYSQHLSTNSARLKSSTSTNEWFSVFSCFIRGKSQWRFDPLPNGLRRIRPGQKDQTFRKNVAC